MLAHEFNLQPSRYFLSIFILIFALTILVMWMLTLPLWMKLIGVSAVTLYGHHIYRRYVVLNTPDAVTHIRYQAGDWQIVTSKGLQKVDLCGDSVLTNVVSILRFKGSEKQYGTCIVFRDSLELSSYRELLLVLKWF